MGFGELDAVKQSDQGLPRRRVAVSDLAKMFRWVIARQRLDYIPGIKPPDKP